MKIGEIVQFFNRLSFQQSRPQIEGLDHGQDRVKWMNLVLCIKPGKSHGYEEFIMKIDSWSWYTYIYKEETVVWFRSIESSKNEGITGGQANIGLRLVTDQLS